ncbi:MAG: indolepyruvate ferredoxin oxidoreductase family protein [Gammaproteobacteria bacterium]|nr:indolepyruvate ferredoxin oxidoreductase family protein [Gammaproteobacteria bacterium]
MDAGKLDTRTDGLREVTLDDKYLQPSGRIYISGTQALARLPMLQKQRDQQAGLNTGGFISGYRGSPLGGLDMALWQAKKHLADKNIIFQAGVNEDLAATSVWGTQQVNLSPNGADVDGVFGMWYGKGPGVDRSADVLKHANAAGTSPHGGVLMLAGDDHAAKSSSVAHQSEHLLIACGIPVLYPSNVQEYLDYGLHGWAMSRYSGLWVSMKCVTDVVESSASVTLDPDHLDIVIPEDFELPEGGLNIRWPDPPLDQEARMHNHKWYAALAYIRANKLNRVVIDSPQARFGIMAAGKAYLDVRQALTDLGLDDAACARIGIRLMKVGCVWPLDAQDAREFATGLEEILVVEEKRQILEYALKEELYNWRDDVRPRIFGKFDERDNSGGEWSVPRGQWLLPACYELSPALIAKGIATRLERLGLPADVMAKINERIRVIEGKEQEAAMPRLTVDRKPWFCSGCPHNTSTRVPEGSRALAGIGCHYMAMWMDRKTDTFTQMGGEGVSWIGQMHFSNDKHVFVNLGDGTYFHSGLLAIRASIAAGANITYKILFNDAVAMTGGQPVDGVLTVPMVAQQVVAEGAKKIVLVSDEPEKYASREGLPDSVSVHHRDQFDELQLQLRDTAGTTIMIYDQTCATEKRRRRKRGLAVDPPRRAFINPDVCEGCGDCSVQSNCLSVEPLDTPLGTKRAINQNSCNKDFSCLKGFCPSFVTLEGAQLRKPQTSSGQLPMPADIPEPELPTLEKPIGIVVTGVGGTGVVTIGALLGMAAHLENKGVTVLDQTGLAQKGGAVMSHVQIAADPAAIHATRIATGEAEVLIGCDEIVSASADALSRVRNGHTTAVINSAHTPTAEFLSNPNWQYPSSSVEQDLLTALGEQCSFLSASQLAVRLLGDSIFTNPLMLGYAWQKGWLPLSRAALLRAMELNGVAVEKNKQAFEWGRVAAYDAELIPAAEHKAEVVKLHFPESVAEVVERRVQLLSAYQDGAYAARYSEAIARFENAVKSVAGSNSLVLSAAKNLAKLMAYKDEYEVARLHTAPQFMELLREQFEGEPGVDYQINYHLAPPMIAKKDSKGHLVKSKYGQWMLGAFKLMRKFKGLRGSWLDVFGKTAERRQERQLVEEYLQLLEELAQRLDKDNMDIARSLLELPDSIRGYGHVKEGNMAAAAAQRTSLLQELRTGRTTAANRVPVQQVV